MTDALADHLREHGVRHPPRPVMPVLPPKITARVGADTGLSAAPVSGRNLKFRPIEPLPMPPPLIWC